MEMIRKRVDLLSANDSSEGQCNQKAWNKTPRNFVYFSALVTSNSIFTQTYCHFWQSHYLLLPVGLYCRISRWIIHATNLDLHVRCLRGHLQRDYPLPSGLFPSVP
jgi:hypothetical protein